MDLETDNAEVFEKMARAVYEAINGNDMWATAKSTDRSKARLAVRRALSVLERQGFELRKTQEPAAPRFRS